MYGDGKVKTKFGDIVKVIEFDQKKVTKRLTTSPQGDIVMQRYLVQVEVELLAIRDGEAGQRAMSRDVAKLKDNIIRVLGLNAHTDYTESGKLVMVGSILLINRTPESRHQALAGHLVNRRFRTSWAALGDGFVWPSTYGDDL